jgi:hypothetical protein
LLGNADSSSACGCTLGKQYLRPALAGLYQG